MYLSGKAVTRADAVRDEATASREAALARESNERTRHEMAENAERTRHEAQINELRSRFEAVNTEARMAEYYILELDGKLMAAGFVPPSRGYGQWKQERRK